MTYKTYDEQLRALEFADYHWRAIQALLRYKDADMMALNRARFYNDVELVVDTLEELKTTFGL